MAQITLNSTGVASSSSLDLQTNGTTSAVTVNTSQNIGFGVTPSPSDGTLRYLQIDGTAILAGQIATEGMRLGSNWYFNGGFKYKGTGTATRYDQGSGAHSWHQATSGTAGNAITFTQAMTLDASGNLGIGTTSPTDTSGFGRCLDIRSSSGAAIYLRDSDDTTNDTFTIGRDNSDSYLNSASGNMLFINAGSERARIDSSGNFLINTTTAGDGKVRISANANAFNPLKIDDTGSTGGNYIQFLNSSGSQAGAINHSGTTSVSYNSGSDYRLKNITGPVTNAIGFINSLKPKVGTWKEDGSKFVGFLAHEFAEVCPQAVQGEKDAVDADGKPLYQSMEASSPEVIANIVSLLQEQQALIQSLTARLDAANL